jgi:hypothetical protein
MGLDLQGLVSNLGRVAPSVGGIVAEGWEPESKIWGRKVRVGVKDGHDGQRLAEFVLARWPEVRKIQLRND